MFDMKGRSLTCNGNNVETDGHVQFERLKISFSRCNDPTNLHWCDSILRTAEPFIRSGFHLKIEF